MFSIQEIKSIVSSFAVATNPDVSLQQKIEACYKTKVKEELTIILNIEDESSCFQEIENYLKEQWEFTKGTCLGYTSQPSSDVTEVLCGLAELVADYKIKNKEYDIEGRPYTAIQILMPGLLLEANHEDYYDLCAIKRCQTFDKNLLNILEAEISRAKLPEFARLFETDDEKIFQQKLEMWEHRSQVKLTEKTVLPEYLADFNKTLTEDEKKYRNLALQHYRYKQLDILKGIQKPNDKQKELIEAEILKPLDADNLQLNRSLQHILGTHILNSSAKYLIPITCIIKDNEGVNPYVDIFEENDVCLNNDEVRRISNHSSETRGYIHNLQELESLGSENKVSFYDNLVEFIKQLKFNDAHGGIGHQSNAGAGAYEAIRIFSDYYESLGYQITSEDIVNTCEGSIHLTASQVDDKWILRYKVSRYNNGSFLEGTIDANDVFDKIEDTATLQSLFESAKDKKDKILSIISRNHTVNIENEGPRGQIPGELKSEIDYFLGLSKDPSKNINATVALNTCIGTRSEVLQRLVNGHKKALQEIALTDSEIARKKSELREALSRIGGVIEEKVLVNAGVTDAYLKGVKDDLPFTKGLLDLLGNDVKFNTLANFKALMHLDIASIQEVLHDANTKGDIINLFSNKVDDLSWSIMEDGVSAEKWKVALMALIPELFDRVIRTTEDIKTLLWNNHGDKFSMLVEILKMNGNLSFSLLQGRHFNEGEKLNQLFIAMLESYKGTDLEKDLSSLLHDFFLNKPESVEFIIDSLPEIKLFDVVKLKDNNGNPIFLTAVLYSPESLKAILEKLSEDEVMDAIKLKDKHGNLIFLKAVLHNPESLKAILEKLSEDGVMDAIKLKENDVNPIFLKAVLSRPESLKAILEKLPEGAVKEAINLEDKDGNPTFLTAVLSRPESLKAILEKLSKDEVMDAIKLKDKDGNPIFLRAVLSSPESLKVIFDKLSEDEVRVAIKLKDKDGNPILFSALEKSPNLAMIIDKLPNNLLLEVLELKNKDNMLFIQLVARHESLLKAILAKFSTLDDRLKMIRLKSKEDGQHLLESLFNYSDSLAVILDSIAENERLSVLKEIGKGGKTVLRNAMEEKLAIKVLLEKLPEGKRLGVLKLKDGNNQYVKIAFEKYLENRYPGYCKRFSWLLRAILDKLPVIERLDMVQLTYDGDSTFMKKIVGYFKNEGLRDENDEPFRVALNKLIEDPSQEMLSSVASLNSIKYILEVAKDIANDPEDKEKCSKVTKAIINALKDRDYKEITVKLVEKLCNLIERPTAYNYYGIFKDVGAYSKTEKINAISKFLTNETLDKNEIGALLQGETGSIIKNCSESLERINKATVSLEKK